MNLINRISAIFILIIISGLALSCHNESYDSKPFGFDSEVVPLLDYRVINMTTEEESDGYLQMVLKMSLKNYQGDIIKFGLSSPDQHQDRLNYYINDFKQDILLVSGTDTISCLDSHFERLYMDLPYRDFILTFKQEVLDKHDHLLINDAVYSNQLLKLSIQ